MAKSESKGDKAAREKADKWMKEVEEAEAKAGAILAGRLPEDREKQT